MRTETLALGDDGATACTAGEGGIVAESPVGVLGAGSEVRFAVQQQERHELGGVGLEGGVGWSVFSAQQQEEHGVAGWAAVSLTWQSPIWHPTRQHHPWGRTRRKLLQRTRHRRSAPICTSTLQREKGFDARSPQRLRCGLRS